MEIFATKFSNTVSVSRVWLVGSVGRFRVTLRVSRVKVRVIRWTLWHGLDVLSIRPKIPAAFGCVCLSDVGRVRRRMDKHFIISVLYSIITDR